MVTGTTVASNKVTNDFFLILIMFLHFSFTNDRIFHVVSYTLLTVLSFNPH